MMGGGDRYDACHHGTADVFYAEVLSDVRRFMTKSEANLSAPDDVLHRLSAFFTPQILAQTIYRTSHCLYVRQWRLLAILLSRLNAILHKVNLPAQTCIGPGLHIPHPCGVTFCGIAGAHCTLYSMATCGADIGYADGPLAASPRLGDRVTVAAHEAVLGPIRIGDDVKTGLFLYRLDFDVPAGVIVRSRAVRPRLHQGGATPDTFVRLRREESA